MSNLMEEIKALENKAPGLEDMHHAFGGVFSEYLNAALVKLRVREEFYPLILDPWNLEGLEDFVEKYNFGFLEIFELHRDMSNYICELRSVYTCRIDEIIDAAGAHLPSILSFSEKALVLLYNLTRLSQAHNNLLEALAAVAKKGGAA